MSKLPEEKFKWLMEFKVSEKFVDKPLKITGIAIKATKSRNNNIYLEEELRKAAPSLIGKPVYIEHVSADKAIGKVVNAWWDESEKAIMYEAEIYDEDIIEKIRKGLIKHVSIAADYKVLTYTPEGRLPKGLEFYELSLVAVPGIPETNIQIIEKLEAKIMESLKAENTANVGVTMEPKPNVPKPKPEVPEPKPAVVENKEEEKVEERMSKEEKEEWLKKLKARSKKYGIKFFEDIVDWKWRTIDEGKLADPVNLHLPVHDANHARAAASLGAKYLRNLYKKDPASAKKVWQRLKRLLKPYGLEISYGPDGEPLKEEAPKRNEAPSGAETVSSNPRAGAVSEKEKVSESKMEKGIVETKEEARENVFKKIAESLREAIDSSAVGAAAPEVIAETIIQLKDKYAVLLKAGAVFVDRVSKGDTVKYPKIPAPSEAAELTEGTAPSDTSITVSTVDITFKEIGKMIKLTKTAVENVGENIVRGLIEHLAQGLALKEEKDIVDAVEAASTTEVGKTDDSLTSSDVLSVSLIAEAIGKLRAKGYAPKWLVIHPEQEVELLKDSQFIEASKYGSNEVLLNGEIGKIFGVRVLVSPYAYKASDANANGVYAKHAYLLADNAVAFVVRRPPTVEEKYEPTERARYIIATERYGVAVLNADAIVKIHSA